MATTEVGANTRAGDATATVAPAPAASAAQPGDLTQSVSSLPAPAVQESQQYVPRVDLPNENLPPNSYGSKLYHGILNALGGSQDITFSRDDTGQMVAHKATSTPGSQWKRIISGALTGFAGAQAAGTQGPGGTLRGFAGGIQAGSQAAIQNRTRARTEADEDYKAKLETATNDLRNSLLSQQVAQLAFQNQRTKVTADQEDIDRLNTFNQLIDDGGAGTQKLGTFETPQDAYKFAADYKDVMGHHVNGRVVIMPNVVDGKMKGITAAIVTPDWQNSRTTRDYTLPIKEVKDGKLVDSTITIPAGEKNSVVTQMLMSYAKEKGESDLQAAQTKQVEATAAAIPEETRAKVTEANAAMLEAHTKEMLGPSEMALNNAKAAAEHDKVSEADFGVGGEKGFEKWHRETVNPALAYEQVYQLASNVYNERQDLKAKGQKFPSGAQSVQFLSSHIAGTFGSVKGARITKDMIQQHLGARSVSDDLQVAIQKLTTGDELSDNQWNAFFQMIGERREETWKTVMDDANALGRPAQYIAYPADFRQRHGLAARVAPAGTVLQQGAAQPATGGGGAAAPPATALKEGINTHFANGQTWTLKNGQPVQVQVTQ